MGAVLLGKKQSQLWGGDCHFMCSCLCTLLGRSRSNSVVWLQPLQPLTRVHKPVKKWNHLWSIALSPQAPAKLPTKVETPITPWRNTGSSSSCSNRAETSFEHWGFSWLRLYLPLSQWLSGNPALTSPGLSHQSHWTYTDCFGMFPQRISLQDQDW